MHTSGEVALNFSRKSHFRELRSRAYRQVQTSQTSGAGRQMFIKFKTIRTWLFAEQLSALTTQKVAQFSLYIGRSNT